MQKARNKALAESHAQDKTSRTSLQTDSKTPSRLRNDSVPLKLSSGSKVPKGCAGKGNGASTRNQAQELGRTVTAAWAHDAGEEVGTRRLNQSLLNSYRLNED